MFQLLFATTEIQMQLPAMDFSKVATEMITAFKPMIYAAIGLGLSFWAVSLMVEKFQRLAWESREALLEPERHELEMNMLVHSVKPRRHDAYREIRKDYYKGRHRLSRKEYKPYKNKSKRRYRRY